MRLWDPDLCFGCQTGVKHLAALGHVEVLLCFSVVGRQHGKRSAHPGQFLQRRTDRKCRLWYQKSQVMSCQIHCFHTPGSKLCWLQAAGNLGPVYSSPILAAVAGRRRLLGILLIRVSFPHPAIVRVAILRFHNALVSQWDCVWVQEPARTGQGQDLNCIQPGTELQLLQQWASAAGFGVCLCLKELFGLGVS